jgi:hypothetical protein
MGGLARIEVVHVVLRFVGYAGLSTAGAEATLGPATTSSLLQKTVNRRPRRRSI